MGLTKAEYAAIQEKIAAELQTAAEYKRMADAQEESNLLAIEAQQRAGQIREQDIKRDNRRLAQWAATIERYADLGEQVRELFGVIEADRKERDAQKGIQREFHNTLSERVDDLEQGLYALMTRDLAEMRRSRGKLGGRIDRRAEIATMSRNLEKLRNQAAQHGPLDTPLGLSNAIEALEQKIEELKTQ